MHETYVLQIVLEDWQVAILAVAVFAAIAVRWNS